MMNYLDKATEQVPDSLLKASVNLVELSRANDDVFQYVLVQVLNKYANSEIVCMDKIYVELVDALLQNRIWRIGRTAPKMQRL